MDANKPQLAKFKEAARKAEADEDEAAWEARLKKVAKHKPVKQEG
ncbi:MAG TPA: hypothetical protein PKC48_03335 [Sphingorhabdus sp.]|jgi:hypothetical protein|nr:hypothetical protein [Sphingorhabdus sp.]HMT40534.1 hypothetical protein [Sphingorhabdus sp.]HMU21291.1 hypothetical protein [Sphingorhabdus sp.]